jgi:hypothetical protein
MPTNNYLPVNLYHGTSTLFIDSIMKSGLGAVNPIQEWKVLELSKEVYDLSVIHLQETGLFQVSSSSFKAMTEQKNSGSFNFQHGSTYLSPCKQTAAHYAIRKRYGSEILTYTIDFLKDLLNLDIPYVKKELFIKYRDIFGFIEACPSPLLIQVSNIDKSSLLDEHGGDPKENIKEIEDLFIEDSSLIETYLQQCNFRLTTPIPVINLKFWLINVQRFDPLWPEYNLYQINQPGNDLPENYEQKMD